MHELGHNLGLLHAGNQDEGSIGQYKPNYASVMAYRYQVTTPDFANPPDTPYYYEDDNRMIVRDFSKCVMCGRCVRACNERQVNQAIAIGYRGAHNKIVARGDSPYIDRLCLLRGVPPGLPGGCLHRYI
jgi:predicted molibdopterin-dependent oxidoreductase YjgC